jgi:hypothetical protein
MAAINFPGPDEREAYTSTPWVDAERQWLWNATKERWEPVIDGELVSYETQIETLDDYP